MVKESVKVDILKAAFQKAKDGFPDLKNIDLQLKVRKVPGTTMRAQPIFTLSSFFENTRSYKIEVNPIARVDNITPTADFPFEVLLGWFAHECGHICDYCKRSNWEMILFGLRYITSFKFRRNVERRADMFAIQNGFSGEILSTKNYLINHSNLSIRYRKVLTKYYYSVEDIEHIIQDLDASWNLNNDTDKI